MGPDEMVGAIGSVLSLVLWWPQAVRVWESRRDPSRLSGVSVATQVLLLTSAAIWGVYAVLTGAFWVGAPGLVNGPLAALSIHVLLKARRAEHSP